MQEKKNPDMYLLTPFCPKMSDMYLKSFDKIRVLKCEDHRAVIVLVVFCIQKGVLQDGKTIQTGYFC